MRFADARFLLLLLSSLVLAAEDDPSQIALHTGEASPLVKSAMRMLEKNIRAIHDSKVRDATRDAIRNPLTCVAHRARLNEAAKKSVLDKLIEEGLLVATPDAQRGIFPPLKDEESACPHLPQTIYGAPGSAWHGHHSYPGGLAVHEAFNQQNALNLLALYRKLYGKDVQVNEDWARAAPSWHDWAKTFVFQWLPNGELTEEFNFGGNGKTDNNGAVGDSRTGAHHILGLAESMARGLPPELLVTQASAHSTPTLGNEYKVVNWLRAASVIARIDPAAKGYLVIDKAGHWRLPPLNHLWDGFDMNQEGKTNLMLDYQIHNLSDADFVESIPAVANGELILSRVAKQFGYDPAEEARYNSKFRNVVFSFVGPERLSMLYSTYGLNRVLSEIQALKSKGAI